MLELNNVVTLKRLFIMKAKLLSFVLWGLTHPVAMILNLAKLTLSLFVIAMLFLSVFDIKWDLVEQGKQNLISKMFSLNLEEPLFKEPEPNNFSLSFDRRNQATEQNKSYQIIDSTAYEQMNMVYNYLNAHPELKNDPKIKALIKAQIAQIYFGNSSLPDNMHSDIGLDNVIASLAADPLLDLKDHNLIAQGAKKTLPNTHEHDLKGNLKDQYALDSVEAMEEEEEEEQVKSNDICAKAQSDSKYVLRAQGLLNTPKAPDTSLKVKDSHDHSSLPEQTCFYDIDVPLFADVFDGHFDVEFKGLSLDDDNIGEVSEQDYVVIDEVLLAIDELRDKLGVVDLSTIEMLFEYYMPQPYGQQILAMAKHDHDMKLAQLKDENHTNNSSDLKNSAPDDGPLSTNSVFNYNISHEVADQVMIYPILSESGLYASIDNNASPYNYHERLQDFTSGKAPESKNLQGLSLDESSNALDKEERQETIVKHLTPLSNKGIIGLYLYPSRPVITQDLLVPNIRAYERTHGSDYKQCLQLLGHWPDLDELRNEELPKHDGELTALAQGIIKINNMMNAQRYWSDPMNISSTFLAMYNYTQEHKTHLLAPQDRIKTGTLSQLYVMSINSPSNLWCSPSHMLSYKQFVKHKAHLQIEPSLEKSEHKVELFGRTFSSEQQAQEALARALGLPKEDSYALTNHMEGNLIAHQASFEVSPSLDKQMTILKRPLTAFQQEALQSCEPWLINEQLLARDNERALSMIMSNLEDWVRLNIISTKEALQIARHDEQSLLNDHDVVAFAIMSDIISSCRKSKADHYTKEQWEDLTCLKQALYYQNWPLVGNIIAPTFAQRYNDVRIKYGYLGKIAHPWEVVKSFELNQGPKEQYQGYHRDHNLDLKVLDNNKEENTMRDYHDHYGRGYRRYYQPNHNSNYVKSDHYQESYQQETEYQLSSLNNETQKLNDIINTTKDLKDMYEQMLNDDGGDVLNSTQNVLDTTNRIIERHKSSYQGAPHSYNYGNSPVTISRDEYEQYLVLLARERQRNNKALSEPVLLDNRPVRYGHNYTASLKKDYYRERNYQKEQLKKYKPRCSCCDNDLLYFLSDVALCSQSRTISKVSLSDNKPKSTQQETKNQLNDHELKETPESQERYELEWQPRNLAQLRNNRVLVNSASLEERLAHNSELYDYLDSLDQVDLTQSTSK